jgi:hypothetical protein
LLKQHVRSKRCRRAVESGFPLYHIDKRIDAHRSGAQEWFAGERPSIVVAGDINVAV